jgi:broad specificity phosphatase PhoE
VRDDDVRPSALTCLLLVRHGETDHNVDGTISTAMPGAPLNERGFAQARLLADRLARSPVEAVYASPLVRARQTAAVLARRLGAPLHELPQLAEVSVGELEGRRDAAAYEILNRALDAWGKGDYDVRLGAHGDVGSVAYARLERAVHAAGARHAGGCAILVSHGSLLQIAVPRLCANLPRDHGHRRFISNCGVIELEVAVGGVRCVRWDGAATGATAAD